MLYAKLSHTIQIVYFESSPRLTPELREMGGQTLETLKRTFGNKKNLSVASLMKLEITEKTS